MEENITIEFVKNWINKHRLTKGSFDSIMRDLIYNSGHNVIDNPYLRDWLIKNPQKFQDLLPIKLNDSQQLVLDWLVDGDNSPFAMISTIDDDFVGIDTGCLIPAKVQGGFEALTNKDQFEVLAAFAEWGMKEVAE
ncbi:hypothetical protein P7D85_11385 [Enterococcus hulanensis]|uniref:DUF1642 domain-containing protein n=1 Tax=Enterococcus hulanensis TaxID=2559929 RepID=A0ABU3EZR7_9ENTE|nr:hypothetical protein [Enterococcus hulanensis]MDT2600379.1 hypothetical protein [Enterococcus hulanensis]MDT2609883.1 hypothetical protein [Enterococcus hulanensis]MDT2617489.1 hypothetical protein [Enterococcus hulanensis]MDT2628714.1 hypothetical protein [Enterococcus hulanensis]MDT2656054.1 hypothetical protein [Enterococcus hulanensis]